MVRNGQTRYHLLAKGRCLGACQGLAFLPRARGLPESWLGESIALRVGIGHDTHRLEEGRP